MEEEIKVDADALAEEIKKKAREGGLVITAYMPPIAEEDFVPGGHFCPIVNVEGYASVVTKAFMINALETTIEQFKEDPQVKFLADGLKIFSTPNTITINKEKKND